jgi:hypothetical protein
MMKVKKVTKLLVLVFGAAALSASAAVASPPATHPGNGSQGQGGKPAPSGANCKPEIMVVLHGTVATAPGASPTLPFQLMVTVKSANAHGKAYVNTTTPMIVPVTVTSSTRIVRQGPASLSSLLAGDQVTVQARTCKADLANGATPQLTARMVIDHVTGSSSDPNSDSTTTTTSTPSA